MVLLVVRKAGLDRTKSFDYNLFYFKQHGVLPLFAILHILLYPFESRLESSFVALVRLLKILVELKNTLILRIDGVVGQVHIQISKVLRSRILIFICSKTCQALFEQVYSHRVNRKD